MLIIRHKKDNRFRKGKFEDSETFLIGTLGHPSPQVI